MDLGVLEAIAGWSVPCDINIANTIVVSYRHPLLFVIDVVDILLYIDVAQDLTFYEVNL